MSVLRPFLIFALAALVTACGQDKPQPALTGLGSPAHGADEIVRVQCGACHEIPGIPDAHGLVGPPLTQFGQRTMVAGLLPNTPDNLVRWLKDPQGVTPGNAMPSSGLTDRQARDVAAYLYTLR